MPENKTKLIPLVEELKAILNQKNISPEMATSFIYHCSSRQMRRWLEGINIPTLLYQREIRKGIKRLKKLK